MYIHVITPATFYSSLVLRPVNKLFLMSHIAVKISNEGLFFLLNMTRLIKCYMCGTMPSSYSFIKTESPFQNYESLKTEMSQ